MDQHNYESIALFNCDSLVILSGHELKQKLHSKKGDNSTKQQKSIIELLIERCTATLDRSTLFNTKSGRIPGISILC